jgi:hypothetical protein
MFDYGEKRYDFNPGAFTNQLTLSGHTRTTLAFGLAKAGYYSDVSKTSIWSWINGTTVPRQRKLDMVAEVLGVDVDSFFAEDVYQYRLDPDKIRNYRERLGMSQKQFSIRLKRSVAVVERLEAGEYVNTKFNLEIAEALQVKPQELFSVVVTDDDVLAEDGETVVSARASTIPDQVMRRMYLHYSVKESGKTANECAAMIEIAPSYMSALLAGHRLIPFKVIQGCAQLVVSLTFAQYRQAILDEGFESVYEDLIVNEHKPLTKIALAALTI